MNFFHCLMNRIICLTLYILTVIINTHFKERGIYKKMPSILRAKNWLKFYKNEREVRDGT